MRKMLQGVIVAAVGMAAVLGTAGVAEAEAGERDRRIEFHMCPHAFPNGSKQVHCRQIRVAQRVVVDAQSYRPFKRVLYRVALNNGASFELIACKGDEDRYRNCYWDAQRMGNGTGNSYANIRGHQVNTIKKR